ncbi:MAG TPA: hypothetical protein DD766_03480 [Desulfovibrio sp.]|nr:hypothetical protein [Desulfovibrio sp.]
MAEPGPQQAAAEQDPGRVVVVQPVDQEHGRGPGPALPAGQEAQGIGGQEQGYLGQGRGEPPEHGPRRAAELPAQDLQMPAAAALRQEERVAQARHQKHQQKQRQEDSAHAPV